MSYTSAYRGSQVDQAAGIVLSSEVSAGELGTLNGVTLGSAVASKALVVDVNRDIANLRNITSDKSLTRLLSLEDLSSDPSDVPPVGRVLIYMKNGSLYKKNSSAFVTAMGGGTEQEYSFTSQTTVNVNHSLGKTYPIVNVYVGGEEMEATITYTDSNNLTVNFASAQTGVIMVRTV